MSYFKPPFQDIYSQNMPTFNHLKAASHWLSATATTLAPGNFQSALDGVVILGVCFHIENIQFSEGEVLCSEF